MSTAVEIKEAPFKGRRLDNRVTANAGIRKGDNTMEEAHRFRVVAWWASGRTGIAKSGSAPNAIHFTSPPAFGGLEGRWTPEDLMLCALASCYTTTFQAVAESSKLEYTDLQVEVEGSIGKAETGYNFTEVVMHANLMIAQPEEAARAVKLLHKAGGLCLVSRALAVKQTFEPRVQVREIRVESSHALPADKEGGFR
jgi:organic hydroperoxide reductase OsmC/OhrA